MEGHSAVTLGLRKAGLCGLQLKETSLPGRAVQGAPLAAGSWTAGAVEDSFCITSRVRPARLCDHPVDWLL